MGRPTRLTPEIAKAIEERVRLTGHLAPAAEQVGIDGTMACEWVARGEGRDKRPKRKVFAQFAQAIKRAQADNVLRRLGRIEQAAKGGTVVAKRTVTKPTRQVGPDGQPIMQTITEERYQEPQWTADAWFLERFDPERWGRRLIEHSGPDGGPIQTLDVSHAAAIFYARVTRVFARSPAAIGPGGNGHEDPGGAPV